MRRCRAQHGLPSGKNEKEFTQAEKILSQHEPILADEAKNQKNAEWKILKEIQRTERTDFFAGGKSEFSELRSSIYREVREEFRDRWANFYTAKEDGADPKFLAGVKAGLIADQKAILEERRDAACAELEGIPRRAVSRAPRWSARGPGGPTRAPGCRTR